MITEDGIWNMVSIEAATMMPAAKIADEQNEYTPVEPVYRGGDKDKEGTEQTTAEELDEASHKCTADSILRRIAESHNFRYVVLWYDYKPPDHTVKLSVHMPEHITSGTWPWVLEIDVVQQLRGQAHVNRKGKVPK